jgi:N-acetylglutamate synthase-like GNAT family acetyltransferase
MRLIGLKKVQQRQADKKASHAKATTSRRQTEKGKKTTDITFRAYQVSDLQWVMELTQKELGDIYQAAYQEPLMPFQVEQMLNMSQQAMIILCKDRPVGYYTYFSDLSRKRHISSLVIEKPKQRSGIGTRVMQSIEDQAKKDGIQVLEVFIQATNQPCIQFVKKLGYQQVQSPFINTICMQKFIK